MPCLPCRVLLPDRQDNRRRDDAFNAPSSPRPAAVWLTSAGRPDEVRTVLHCLLAPLSDSCLVCLAGCCCQIDKTIGGGDDAFTSTFLYETGGDRIRKLAGNCTGLQGFLVVFNAVGGGTSPSTTAASRRLRPKSKLGFTTSTRPRRSPPRSSSRTTPCSPPTPCSSTPTPPRRRGHGGG